MYLFKKKKCTPKKIQPWYTKNVPLKIYSHRTNELRKKYGYRSNVPRKKYSHRIWSLSECFIRTYVGMYSMQTQHRCFTDMTCPQKGLTYARARYRGAPLNHRMYDSMYDQMFYCKMFYFIVKCFILL